MRLYYLYPLSLSWKIYENSIICILWAPSWIIYGNSYYLYSLRPLLENLCELYYLYPPEHFWVLFHLYPLSPLLDISGDSIICILWAPFWIFMGTLLFVSSELLLDYLSVFSKPPPEILMGTLLFVSSEPRPGIYLGTLLLVYSEPSCNISGNSIICILWASSLNISGDSLICILWALS